MNYTKPGYKTTEFWVNLVFNVGCLIAMALMPEEADKWIPLVAAALSNTGYHVSRGNAKRTEAKMEIDFNEMLNSFCRKFRIQRDKILGIAEDELKKKLDEFWNDQPWYVRLFRKQIMREAYKFINKL